MSKQITTEEAYKNLLNTVFGEESTKYKATPIHYINKTPKRTDRYLKFQDWLDENMIAICVDDSIYTRVFNVICRNCKSLESFSEKTDEEIANFNQVGAKTLPVIIRLRENARDTIDGKVETNMPVKTGDEMARELLTFVNAYTYDSYGFAKEICSAHRTLQQSVMKMFVILCQEMAKEEFYDERNEASVKLAQAVSTIADIYALPLV